MKNQDSVITLSKEFVIWFTSPSPREQYIADPSKKKVPNSKYDENIASFELIKNTPTVWDETISLAGEIGEFIVVARRSGNTWYIGAMNGDIPRSIEIDLSFLGQGSKSIKAYIDGMNASQQAKDFKVIESVIKDNKLKIDMVRGGGYIGIIR